MAEHLYDLPFVEGTTEDMSYIGKTRASIFVAQIFSMFECLTPNAFSTDDQEEQKGVERNRIE